ncbi:MAG: zinc ABC transporter substrate-binding protein [bacterium]|nr:zinc ABC transporter substrate-binding protein [Parabacteroides sp.]MDD6079827.1 zinc ABC transporter substrate-binding protein [bacterium]
MRHYTHYFLALVGLLLLSACGDKRQRAERMISVTIEPQRYFAERIAGEHFAIHCVVPAGQSPETYDPTPQQMVQIGQSEAYLRIGSIGFELAWMKAISENNPNLQIFDLSQGMPLLQGEEEAEEEHEHDHAHEAAAEAEHHHHHHGGVDPHIWSSIQGARIVAQNTLTALQTLDPTNAETYNANYQQVVALIDSTEAIINTLLKPLAHRSFIIYHPALTYLAAEYELEQLCIEMEGKEPSPAQLKTLVETAQAHHTKVVFVQQEFDQKNAELIAKETGCQLTPINPLAYDWSREMIRIAKALADGEVD